MNQAVLVGILLCIGAVALAIAFVIYQAREFGWLKQHGKQIIAMVTSIRHESGETRSGFPRDNYYVTAQWTNPRTGRTYTFWSWIMNSCPEYVKGSLVPVLIDPSNPQHFVMEL